MRGKKEGRKTRYYIALKNVIIIWIKKETKNLYLDVEQK